MQVNIATGNAIINATQDGIKETVTLDSRKNQLERRINMLKSYLESNDCDEQTVKDMEEAITDYEKELSQLN